MKINLIVNQATEHNQVDVETLQNNLRKCKEKPEIAIYNASHFKCNNASINLFVNVINPLFFNHAKLNVGVYDPNCIGKEEMYMLADLNRIYVKTKYAKQILESELGKYNYNKDHIINLGWTSPNMSINSSQKSFKKVLLFCKERNNPIYEKIVTSWKENYPELYVVNALANRSMYNVTRENLSENVVFCDKIKNDKFHSLFNECGFQLCVDESNSYDHMVNQCKLVRSIPIGMKGASHDELLNRDYAFILGGKRKKNKNNSYGSCYSVSIDSVHEVMENILSLSENSISVMARDAFIDARTNDGTFGNTFKTNISELIQISRTTKKVQSKKFTNEELPSVTFVTVSHQRHKNFPLAIYNYNSIEYPRDKLKWVIVEDVFPEQQTLESLLPTEEKRETFGIHYEKIELEEGEEKKTIGWKRNLAMKNINTDYVLLLDDDDYMYPSCLHSRMCELLNIQTLKPNKLISGMNMIGCFDVNRYISMINVSPSDLSLGKRIAEGTLLFHSSLLKEKTDIFSDTNQSEACEFLNQYKTQFVEQSWENRFVSILHSSNASGRKPPEKNEANGCHFKFSEKLFDFICKLFKEEKETTQPKPIDNVQKTEVEQAKEDGYTLIEEETI
jgi:hypothetical protein